jgi:putative heme-binding domain-containing protein
VERNDQEATLQEITRLPVSVSSHAKFECAWTLHGMDATSASLLDKLATNPDPNLQAWAARFTGEKWRVKLMHRPSEIGAPYLDELSFGDETLSKARSRLGMLAKSSNLGVRHAVAVALRQFSGGCLTVNRPTKVSRETRHGIGIIEGLAVSIARDSWIEGGPPPNVDPVNPNDFPSGKTVSRAAADQLVSFAVWQALEPLTAEHGPGIALRGLAHLGGKHPGFNFAVQRLCRRVSDEANPKKLISVLESLHVARPDPELLAACLESLATSQNARVTQPEGDVTEMLSDWRTYANLVVRKHAQTLAVLWGDEVAVKEMIVALHDASKPEKERIAVLQSLRKVKTEAVKEGLKPLLAPSTSTTLGVAAIRAAADLGGDEFVLPLIIQAASKDFNVRNAAIEALSSRPYWTRVLLKSIADGSVPSAGFPAPVRRALATNKDKDLRDLAFQVLGAWQDSSEDVKSLIAAKKQACLTGEPDLANGKLMFTATCMVCHEFHGGGQKVGPDLIGSGRSNLDAILANVIDPNQIIGNGYENFTVSTKDGRTLAGRVVEDTPGHVKLLGAGGAAQVVPRDQIAALTNTKQSLMPMGFGNLPDAAFRDLIWYILAPPEEGPLTPEKKKLLIQGVEVPETAAKPKGTNWRAIDWESVSLWNPDWKVSAPDFERTPVKLAEYHGKTNVLLMHPFPDKKTPASFERKMKVEKTKLTFHVAADDRGDWVVKAVVNGQEVKTMTVDHDKPRWKTVQVDLAKWKGQEITLRLEGHANGWSMEFGYWQGITLE